MSFGVFFRPYSATSKSQYDERIMRIVGFVGVMFGLALIYVGVYVV